jgi:hypothetical protein
MSDVVIRPSYIIDRLRRLGNARDRVNDTQLRVVTLDDEDAQQLVAYIESLEG